MNFYPAPVGVLPAPELHALIDGNAPIGNLVIDAKGNLYGVTRGGGTFDLGTIFKLDTTGHDTILRDRLM